MDILHDEAIYFGMALKEKGIPCHIVDIPGSYHSFDYDIDNEYVRAIVERELNTCSSFIAYDTLEASFLQSF